MLCMSSLSLTSLKKKTENKKTKSCIATSRLRLLVYVDEERLECFMTEVSIIRNHSIDLQNKSIDWFLYDKNLRHERVNVLLLESFGVVVPKLMSELYGKENHLYFDN